MVFLWVPITGNNDYLEIDGTVNSTSHRAHLSRATHASSLDVCTFLKIEVFCWMQSVCFLTVIPCFTTPSLDPYLSSHFSTSFHTFTPGSSTSPSLLYPSTGPSTHPLQGGFALADWLNNPLSQRTQQGAVNGGSKPSQVCQMRRDRRSDA